MNPYEPEPLSFTITDPWRPVVPVVKPPPARRSASWKIAAVCGGTFLLGMFVMVAIGVLEAPPTTRMASTARMPVVAAPPPPPPPPVIEIVQAPPAPPPAKAVRRASPAPKRPRVVVATPGLFDSPD
jgi:hypothetical protein